MSVFDFFHDIGSAPVEVFSSNEIFLICTICNMRLHSLLITCNLGFWNQYPAPVMLCIIICTLHLYLSLYYYIVCMYMEYIYNMY